MKRNVRRHHFAQCRSAVAPGRPPLDGRHCGARKDEANGNNFFALIGASSEHVLCMLMKGTLVFISDHFLE
jgi:hypothetical protein